MKTRLSCYLLMSCTLIVSACENSSSKISQEKPNQDWLVSGRMSTDDFMLGEVVALALDGKKTRTEIKDDQSFSLNLDANTSYAVYFLAAPSINNTTFSASNFISTAVGPNLQSRPPALLTFEESEEIGMSDTLHLPKASPLSTLDLGAITIKGDFAYATNNPSHKLDFDDDGINDSQDPDTRQHSKQEQVALCHKGQELTLPLDSLLGHLNHGDKLGDCEDDEHENESDNEEEQITNTSDLSIKDQDHHENKPPQRQKINTPIFIEEIEDDGT